MGYGESGTVKGAGPHIAYPPTSPRNRLPQASRFSTSGHHGNRYSETVTAGNVIGAGGPAFELAKPKPSGCPVLRARCEGRVPDRRKRMGSALRPYPLRCEKKSLPIP